MTSSSQTSPAQPINDRIEALDLLRGVALLGIYLSIIPSFNSSLIHGNPLAGESGLFARLWGAFESLIISKRFIGMFSLLFGVGVAIQYQNFVRRGQAFGPYFVRRMLILGALGAINTSFFFHVEILMVYAVFGLLAMMFYRAPTKFTLGLAAASFALWGSIFEVTLRPLVFQVFRWVPRQYSFERIHEIYSQGPILEQIKLRWIEYGTIYADNAFHLGMSLAMILAGVLIGKHQLHVRFIENLAAYQKAVGYAGAYSLGFLFYGLAQGQGDFLFIDRPVATVFYLVFQPCSMFVYIYLAALFCTRIGSGNLLRRALINNGKLSLTGYMGGAAAFALIFYYPGAALCFQYAGPALSVIAVAVYAGFTIFSSLWLTRFRRGPMEWLYRRLAYGTLRSG
ncbi:MAG: DUF418 domain-containing protein [Synoicihabitans sp.]